MNIEIQNTPQNIVSLVTPKLKLLPEFFNNITIASASGEKVGFMNTVGLPLRFVDVATEIVAVQSGSGDPSPDNVRPITGFNTGNIIVSPTENQGDGTTYIVAWHSEAGTVYGGEVDVTKGKLTVTHKCVDMGDLTWVAGASGTSGVYTMRSSGIENEAKRPPTSGTVAEIVCSAYPTINSDQAYQKVMGISLTRLGVISVYDENYNGSTSPADFKTAMTGKQLMYALATPVEYDITPVDAIKMLNGQNFVWSNTGNISVVYYKKVGANDNVQTLMRSSAPSLGMERQEVEDRPLADIVADLSGISALHSLVNDEREPIEREEIEDEPAEIAEEEPQDEEPIEEPQESVKF